MTKGKLVQSLLAENQKESALYTGRKAVMWRKAHSLAHPTEIAVLECMDGRVHAALSAEFPVGTVLTLQSLGGKFDFGVSHFSQTLRSFVAQSAAVKRNCLIFATYHYSKGNHHRGCAGYKYDTEAAMAGTEKLRGQIANVFGKSKNVVYPVLVGIETDEDSFVIHGKKGKFSVAENLDVTEKELVRKLGEFLPDMPLRMVRDLAFFLEGNIRHVKALRAAGRTEKEMQHGEQVIALGRGLGWIHSYNRALVIGPWCYDMADSVATAGTIILGNLKDGRIPKEDGVVLLASAQYADDSAASRAIAQEEARSLSEYARDIIVARVPDLAEYLHVLPGTVNPKTKLFTPVEIK